MILRKTTCQLHLRVISDIDIRNLVIYFLDAVIYVVTHWTKTGLNL